MQVLVVEDEAIIGADTVETLREAGHTVSGPATTVDDAVRLAEETHADLALVDINLCGTDEGPRLARALWALFGVPSLFVTAQPEQARQHKDAAVGVLTKPYAAGELVQSVPVARAVADGEEPRTWRPRNLELFYPV